jgi:predicted dehydrogenase
MAKNWLNTAIVGIGKIFFDGHEKIYKQGKYVIPVAYVDWDEARATQAMNVMKAHYQKLHQKTKADWAEVALQNLKVYTSVDKMLDEMEGKVDLIDCCTHTREHIPIALKALARNVNVQAEKPPALNFLETKMLVEAEKKSKAHYQLAEHVCFEKSTIAMRKMIAEGYIGDLSYVEINFGHNGPYWPYVVSDQGIPHFIDPLLGGGGVLQDLAPHGISRAYWPLGDDIKVLTCNTKLIERRRTDRTMSGKPVDCKVDDYAIAEFTAKNEKTGKIFSMKATNSWCGHPGGEQAIIKGEKGTVVSARSRIIKRPIVAVKFNDGGQKEAPRIKDNYHSYDAKIRETQMFADLIMQGKKSPCDSVYAHKLQTIMSLHYFGKMKGREVTTEEMYAWGDELLKKNNNDFRKAIDFICLEFAKTVDLK